MSKLRLIDNFKLKGKECFNPISGHCWTEPVPTNTYSIMTPFGREGNFKSLEKAEKALAEWQAFYDKFFP